MKLVGQSSQELQIRCKKPPLTTKQHTTPFEMGFVTAGAVGAPLFELESIEISGTLLNQVGAGAGVQVHGWIILTDDLGNQFSLFSRPQKGDGLLINLNDNSSLNIPRDKLGDARCLPSSLLLDFQLRLQWQQGIADDNAVEFKEQMLIDCTTNVTYDKLQQCSSSMSILNNNLQVCVHYMIFGCAALARPGFVVRKTSQNATDDDNDDDNSVVELSGWIDVCYQMSDLSWITLRLFGEEEAVQKKKKVELGGFVEGPTLAYPAYSTLFFELDLLVNGEHFVYARDTLTFDFNLDDGFSFEIQVHGQKYSISLIMYRAIVIHCEDLPENKIREWCDADAETMKIPNKKRPTSSQLNDQKPIYIQPHLESLNDRYWVISRGGCEELVEIFSIYICSYHAQRRSLGLKGYISCYDMKSEVDLFQGGIVHPYDIVKLAPFALCFMGYYFGIQIDLEDDEGRQISKGYATYDEGNAHRWFDRRICSVIRGKCGYAAVHYSIFQDAVEAYLKFKVATKVRGGYEVCGEISTRYNNMRYATHYEKKYYQSRLFEKRDYSEAVMLEEDETIPLLKSTIAVPLKASLIVVGNIHVLQRGRLIDSFKLEEMFRSKKPLSIFGVEFDSTTIDGSHVGLLVHVEWGYKFAQSRR